MTIKTFLLSVLLALSIHVNAQTEQPLPKDLSVYAPLNPKQGNAHLPVQLSNKKVASILVMNNTGAAIQQTIYNEDGWPVTMANTSQVFYYAYSSDKRRIKVNQMYIYDLDTEGNVTQYLEIGSYGVTQVKIENTYDEKGNLIQTKKYSPTQIRKGQYSMKSNSLVKYKYDDKKRKIAETGGAL